MLTLTQFILRLSFGLSLAMAITPPRLVTSGYYRNNLYVLLGLAVLATLVAFNSPSDRQLPLAPPLVAACVSYLGAVAWLYERRRLGMAALAAVAIAALIGTWLALPVAVESATWTRTALVVLDCIAGGLVLGTTLGAMFLGHWYLNAPGMPLAPLQRLVVCMAGAVALRAVVSGVGLTLEWTASGPFAGWEWIVIVLRWLAGIVGTSVLIVMTWQTLKVPNTQSATGMLYVAVITTFLGELTGQLLSERCLYPL